MARNSLQSATNSWASAMEPVWFQVVDGGGEGLNGPDFAFVLGPKNLSAATILARVGTETGGLWRCDLWRS